MTRFTMRVKHARKRQEMKFKRAIVNGVAIAALIGAAAIFTGSYDGDQQLVEETYIVKKGDTLRTISEAYLPKNTGGRRYILEFEQGIEELNPWIRENHYVIHPGDKIRVNYWIKKESGDKHEADD